VPQKRFLRVRREGSRRKSQVDISARRGAPTDKKTTPPDLSEMVNGFELFKGSLVTKALQLPSYR
jgi:hypothetical protein